MDTEHDPAEIDADNDLFDRFHNALRSAGCHPQPWWWLEFCQLQSEDTVSSIWCVPVTDLPAAEVVAELTGQGFTLEQGVLPERIEHYLELGPNPGISDDFTAPHPGCIPLWELVTKDGAPRQTHRLAPDGTVNIELVVDQPR